MKPAPFTYHAPATAEEAVALLARHAADDARILAGGQSLIAMMAFRLARPAHLVDINGVAGFGRLAVEDGGLAIGACVRHAAFERPVEPGALGALLAEVVRHIGHGPIRARGTFCGSLANADPASEWCLVAATLGATVALVGPRGARRVAADEFLSGPMSTTLAADEIVAGARLDRLPPGTRFGFDEICRRAGDFALAMALAVLRLDDGRIAGPLLGVGGAEGRPRRMAAAEAVLAGRSPTPAVRDAAAEAAAAAVDPIEDAQTDAAFRRDLVRAVVRRALDRALA